MTSYRLLIQILIGLLIASGLVWFGLSATLFNTTPVINSLIDDSFDSRTCTTKTVPNLDPLAYTGPMIDTHIHIAPLPDGPVLNTSKNSRPVLGSNITINDYVCMMTTGNIRQVFAFFPVWEPIIDPSISVVKRVLTAFPDKFVPFIMPPEHDDKPGGFPTVDATALTNMLNQSSNSFAGYGEIGLYARVHGAKALSPNSPRLTDIYPVVRKHNMVIYFHLGEGQQSAFEAMAAANRDITFIWHGDQLVHHLPDNKIGLDDIEAILNRHPNVYYGVDELYGGEWLLRPEVSKSQFLAHFNNPEPLLEIDLATFKDFITRHPDQVLWGTDRGWSSAWSVDSDVAVVLNQYMRSFIGRLDPTVQAKYAYQNAERIINHQQ